MREDEVRDVLVRVKTIGEDPVDKDPVLEDLVGFTHVCNMEAEPKMDTSRHALW